MTESLSTTLIIRATGDAPEITITTPITDLMGDTIDSMGMDTTGYMAGTRAVNFAHDHSRLPIGKTITLAKSPAGITATFRWLESNPEAATVRAVFEEGVLGASVEFVPVERAYRNGGGEHFSKSILTGWALTANPANQECMRLVKSLGLSGNDELTIIAATPSGNAIIAGSDTEIAQCMRTIREEMVTALHEHARSPRLGRLIEGSVQRGINHLRGRIDDGEELSIELADVPPPRGHKSSGRTLEIDATPTEINTMMREVARGALSNLDTLIAKHIAATINRLRGRID